MGEAAVGGETAQQPPRSRRQSGLIVLVILVVVVVAAVGFRQAKDQIATPAPGEPTVPAIADVQAPPPIASAINEPEPQADYSEHPVGSLALAESFGLELAPLGTYIVARAVAGVRLPSIRGLAVRRAVPVYDEPGGSPRTMLDVNGIDGIDLRSNLINWDGTNGALVLRVIAGEPDDDWLVVQAPTRPHDRFIWVRRRDFDFGSTALRIEIDLADQGEMTVFDRSTGDCCIDGSGRRRRGCWNEQWSRCFFIV